MIRVLTPIAIALFFIGYPPFHRLQSLNCPRLEAFDLSRSFSSAVHSARCAVFHCDEFTVSPRAPNPIVNPGWLDPDKSQASGRIALSRSPSSTRRAQNRGCIDEFLQ